MLIYIFVI